MLGLACCIGRGLEAGCLDIGQEPELLILGHDLAIGKTDGLEVLAQVLLRLGLLAELGKLLLLLLLLHGYHSQLLLLLGGGGAGPAERVEAGRELVETVQERLEERT